MPRNFAIPSTLLDEILSIEGAFEVSSGGTYDFPDGVEMTFLQAASSTYTQTPAPMGVTMSLPFPDTVLTGDQATFKDLTGWNAPSGVTYDTTGEGKAVLDGTAGTTHLNYTMQPLDVTGKVYTAHFAFTDKTVGRARAYLRDGGATETLGSNRNVPAHHVVTHRPTSPHTTFRVSAFDNPELSIIDAQLVDITTLVNQPKAIFLQFGQSNRVGAFGVSGYDPEIDKPEFRALAVPTLSSTSIGAITDNTGSAYGISSKAGIGELMTLSTPMTHATSAQVLADSPPATMPVMSEARHVCDNWPSSLVGYTPTYLLSAATATSLFTGWDHEATPQGGYLRLMRANIEALLAENPDNFIAGAVWQQGEADGSRAALYVEKFTGFINELRADYGEFPLVIAEVGGRLDEGAASQMIAEQRKLATDSGDPAALTKCAYVGRPAGDYTEVLEDEGGQWIHYRADANRAIGSAVGAAMVDLLT